MNVKLKVISACVLLSMSVSATQALAASDTNGTTYLVNRGNPQLKANGKYIDQMIAEVMAKNNLPGLSMAIVQAPIFRVLQDTAWLRQPMMNSRPPRLCGGLGQSLRLLPPLR